MTPENRKATGIAAVALVAAAAGGFTIARMTAGGTATAANTQAEKASAPTDQVTITAEGIRASAITVAPAGSGALDAAIQAPGTVGTTPDAEAVVTARSAGTVTRIFRRLGDNVRAGETIALVESRDAATIAADRSAASARVALAARQLERERFLLRQGVTPREAYETAQANLQVAQAELRRAAATGYTARVTGDGRSVSVQSPIAGRISAMPGQLGASVQGETELFRVVDPSRLQIVASMPPADAARVRPGDRVEITISGNNVIEGSVRSAIQDVSDQTRQASVVITLNANSPLIAPGQMVRTRVFASGGARSNSVLVPQDAVQTLGDRTVVFVRNRDGFRAQTISAGRRGNGLVEVLSGLAAGTPIATTNAFRLKSEMLKGDDE